MVFKPNCIYHLHNLTFNRTLAFTTRANYRFFIHKLSELRGACELLSYCLMPDHFDLVVYMPQGCIGLCRTPNGQMQVLSRRIGSLLSSYARAYNKQQRRKGSLFQPKTKSNLVSVNAADYFDYLHRQPVSSGLVFEAEDWEFSSYGEHHGRGRGICNIGLARDLLGL